MIRLRCLLLILLGLATTACGDDPASPPTSTGPTFVDITEAAGLDWTHESGAYGKWYFPETMGGG